MALANEWLRDCMANHPMCPRPSTSLPLRVIDVGTENIEPVLCITGKDENAQYTALSHCWGELQPITTTAATLEQRKQSIPLSSLPKTFQHAIVITRRLGVQYLWIDSLCILQDSVEDWSHQAANMAAIYSGAAVVIAADAALNCLDGCFDPHEQQGSRRNISVPISCVDDQGADCKVYARKQMWRKNWHDLEHFTAKEYTEYNYPTLQLRGWVLQERLLSPRILHYGSTELSWECWSQVSCECTVTPEHSSRDASTESVKWRVNMIGNTPLLQQDSVGTQSSEDILRQSWCNLIEHYTQLHLSFQSDRLAAISGLATKFSKSFDSDEYICGLWRNDFVRGLTWYVSSGKMSKPSLLQEVYIAPSWSWGSVTGEIKFPAGFDRETVDVEILDIHYTPVGSNPFAAVNHACITARGCLLPIWIDTKLQIHYRHKKSSSELSWPRNQSDSPDIDLDVTSGEEANHECINQVPLQLLVLQRAKRNIHSNFIVLRAVKGASTPNTFQRIGYTGRTKWWWENNFRGVCLDVLCDTTERQVFRWI
jgi:hypothetical protein